MALQKELINEKGIITNYHKISNVNLQDNYLQCSMDSYVSKEYRDAGHSADYSTFNFTITVEEEESMGIRALCYSKIKELEDWATAVDC